MYTKYVYSSAQTVTNLQADLVALLTGETNVNNLSSGCDKVNTSITATTAAGWAVHDGAPPPMLNAWGLTSTLPQALTYNSIAYSSSLSRFVCVSNTIAMYSSDGVIWNNIGTFPAIMGKSVCWSPELGMFLAVGNTVANAATNIAASSPDGITWTQRTLPYTQTWTSVCWSPFLNRFVAVSSSNWNSVAYSSNGIDWYGAAIANYTWLSVCWSEELHLFVAVANANNIAYSSNGTTWNTTTAPTSFNWTNVIWGGKSGIFMATPSSGSNTSYYATSVNGVDWVMRLFPAMTNCTSLAWIPELGYFYVFTTSTTYYFSIDGITWSSGTLATANKYGVAYSYSLGILATISTDAKFEICRSSPAKILKAPVSDTANYKYAELSVGTAVLFLSAYETWDNTAHAGTNQCYNSNVIGVAALPVLIGTGGTIYVSSSARHIAVFPSTASSPIGVFETKRQSYWDTPSNGYPPYAWVTLTGPISMPRVLNSLAVDVVGLSAYSATGITSYFGALNAPTTSVPIAANKGTGNILIPLDICFPSYGYTGNISQFSKIYLTTTTLSQNQVITVDATDYIIWSYGSNRLAVKRG